jgi:hypothetical protein
MPPIDEEKAATPRAVDRLLLNQWAMTVITGPNMNPQEICEGQELTSSYWSIVKHY